MTRCLLCVLTLLASAASAAAQDKKADAIPLKQAIDDLDKKLADLRAEFPGRVAEIIKADGSSAGSEAARALTEQHRLILETEINVQRLLTLQSTSGKASAAKKPLDGWLEQVEKATPKLPQPEVMPALDFAEVDKYALATPVAETKSVPRLARYLTKEFKTDKEKARAIFTWMAHNIVYDTDGLVQKKVVTRPDLVLQSGATICGGYTNTYEALGKSVGLPITAVPGWSRVLSEDAKDPRTIKTDTGLLWNPHGWNAIKLDGKLYFIDVTWSAGRMRSGGKTEAVKLDTTFDHFLIPAEEFAYIRVPNDPRWQGLKTPLSKKDIEALPMLWPRYFQLGMKIGNPVQPALVVRDSVVVTVEAPEDVEAYATVCLLPDRDHPKRIYDQVRGRTIEFRYQFPERGAYELLVLARKRGDSPKDNFRPVITYRVEAKEAAAKQNAPPISYASAAEGGTYLYWPLTEKVAAGKPQGFAVSVPKADKVVIVSSGNKHTPLEKRGDIFAGNATLERGEVLIAAFYPDAPEGQALFKLVAE